MTQKEKIAFDSMYFAILGTLQALSCGDIINGDCAPEDKHHCVRALDNAKDSAEGVYRSRNAQSLFVGGSGKYEKQASTVVLSASEEIAIQGAFENNVPLWPVIRTILMDHVPELYQELK